MTSHISWTPATGTSGIRRTAGTSARRGRLARSRRRQAVLAALTSLVLLVPPAAATPVLPLAQEEQPGVASRSTADASPEMWANPQARSTDPVASGVNLAVVDIVPTTVTVTNKAVRYRLRITNRGDTPLTNLTLRVHRRAVAKSPVEIRLAQLANIGEYPFTTPATPLPVESIAGGTTQDIMVTVPLDAGHPTNKAPAASSSSDRADVAHVTTASLGQLPAGMHPLLFSINSGEAPLALARATLTITPSNRPPAARNATPPAPPKRTPLTLLYPLAAQTHVTPGMTGQAPTREPLYVTVDDLAAELGDGGRLRNLLDVYRSAIEKPGMAEATCLALDPELIDTVERMTHGYFVGSNVPDAVREQRRLRDSWADILRKDDNDAEPGRGKDAAQRWLDDLRDVTRNTCTVPLPYAGVDLNALGQAVPEPAEALAPGAPRAGVEWEDADGGGNGSNSDGNDGGDALPMPRRSIDPVRQWLADLALTQGYATLNRILDIEPVQGVVIPNSGYISPAAAGVLRHAAAPEQETPSARFEERLGADAVLLATEPKRSSAVVALVAENTIPGGAGNPTTVPAAAAGTRIAPHAVATPIATDLAISLRATGAVPEIAGYSNPDLRYDVESDSSASRMSVAIAVLDHTVRTAPTAVIVPPADWSVTRGEAQEFLAAVAAHLRTGDASPRSLPTLAAQARSNVAATPAAPVAPAAMGTPYVDPGAIGSQNSAYTQTATDSVLELTLLMRNDPNIALTRESFTHPLFKDLLRAISSYGLRSRALSTVRRNAALDRLAVVARTEARLRHSVSLLPPGSVFTRTSELSPLLVVARNGLPLPVSAEVDFSSSSPNGSVRIPSPGPQLIPAKGSITVSLMPEMTNDASTTDVSLWLQKDDIRISNPIQLRVQSARGTYPWLILSIGIFIAVIVGVMKLVRARRKALPHTFIRRIDPR